jgi:glycosyltransferase involved in cell wall biosynthesis
VVLAARNEEARIERTIRRLLDQRGVALEVIAVDDRSTDGTNEILRRLAKEDARVRVQRVESLPEGWLGKCHACHTGASVATGEWILFTDADCWLKPDAIARALRVARLQKADHVALTPGVAPETVGGQAWHLAFLLSVVDWISRVNHDKPKAYLGMGAFNLIRAEVYRACGGYEALRLTVLDDVRLGLLVRRASKRTRAFIGGDDAECHWEATARSMIKIMEKKLFRGAGLSDRSCLRGWPGRTGRMGSCGHGSAYRHCQGWRRDWLWVR